MSRNIKKIICVYLAFTTALVHLCSASLFKFNKDTHYRLESQANGAYIHIGPGWWNANGKWDKPVMAFIISASVGGMWKFSKAGEDGFYIYNDSEIKDKPKKVFLASPDGEGGKVIITSDKNENAIWLIKRVLLSGKRDVGFFTIKSKKTNLYLTRSLDWNAANLREPKTKDIVLLPMDKKHPRTQYWSIEPTINNTIETLAVPQGGWSPWAMNKIAVYNSSERLDSIPKFTLTRGKSFKYTGEAFCWGQYWNKQYFYIINLNTALKGVKKGTFTLKFNGKRVKVRITNNAYTNPFRQEGRDRFTISDLFDKQWGFVGHWGHLSTWYPKGLISLGMTKHTWIDELDANKNGKKIELIEPETPVTEAESKNALLGGWDMTDKSSHSYGCDGRVLRSLEELYHLISDKKVKKSIIHEIEYGVKGLLVNQAQNGSWRQRANDWTYWVGTTANIGAGLASVQKLLKKYNHKLAVKNKIALKKAWAFVYKNRFNRKKWAIKDEGILPDGSVLTIIPQSHRQGYTEAYLSFAVEMAIYTGKEFFRDEVNDIIERAGFGKNKKIRSISGETFPGEQDFTGSGTDIILTLFKYYSSASPKAQGKIKDLVTSYYKKHIVSYDVLDGPYGKDGKALFYDYTGGQWRLPYELLIACNAYKLFGDKFSEGILVSQRKLDWWTGCNPYYTSLILGVGDRFLLNGWSSYHALGRQVGMNSGPGKWTLQASLTNYIGKETTTGGCVALWLGITMLENISIKGVDTISLYSENEFSGEMTRLTEGEFRKNQLTALGMALGSVKSIKMPAGFKVTVYSEPDFSGKSLVITENLSNIKEQFGTVASLIVTKEDTLK